MLLFPAVSGALTRSVWSPSASGPAKVTGFAHGGRPDASRRQLYFTPASESLKTNVALVMFVGFAGP